MNTIVKFLDVKQKKSPELIADEKKMKKRLSLSKNAPVTEIEINSAKNITWVAIAPWTECTKSCGGGKSYLERICILPVNSKLKCEGERILTKECNMDPCEKTGAYTEELKLLKKTNGTIKFKSPAIKYLPVSRRANRYERCFIKEGDLSIYISSGEMKGTKIPMRVILNNRTITAYSNDVRILILNF
jgi:hypothetical protein